MACCSAVKAGVLVAALAATGFALTHCNDPSPSGPPSKTESVQVGDKSLKLKIITEETERRDAALNGTRPGKGEGTLLVYPAPETVRMDMAHYSTPLDILFLDQSGKIVGQKEEPSPAPPKAPPPKTKVYINTSPAYFTLQLPAGAAAELKLKEGDTLKIDAAKLIKQAAGPLADVEIAGRTFHLEQALYYDKRLKGLSDRTDIAADGGMIFVFPNAQPLSFVMRDCPIGIDIIFLDGAGRVVATHKMDPQLREVTADENEYVLTGGSNRHYEDRLKPYPSGFPAQFVIELKSGTLDSFNPPVKKGDKVKLHVEGLKSKAK